MRYVIKISYNGRNYCGYQKQKNKKTIQDELEKVFSHVLNKDIILIASGRTDAGVSAIEQICHFDIDETIDEKRFLGYVNSLLPNDIRVIDITIAQEGFHSRYSSKKKTYEYLFYVSKTEIPVYDTIASHIGYNIDVEKMKKACKYFIGEHDFSAFCASNTSVVDKVRIIYNVEIHNIEENFYKLVITGNGFLYNMVRIIMGTLVEVGSNKIKCEDIPEIIKNKDRNKAGKTAEAKGLYLKKVVY